MRDRDKSLPNQSDLDELQAATETIRVLKRPISNPPVPELCLNEITGLDRIEELFTLLRLEATEPGDCYFLSVSEYYFEFLPSGESMMVESTFLRWDKWGGDAPLANPEALNNWFKDNNGEEL